jgi:hypothetical protein
VAIQLGRDELQRLARMGAQVRLAALRQERAKLTAILDGEPSNERRSATQSHERPKRHRARWTTAQRKAVSERMKKYWAARRAAGNKGAAKRARRA